MKLKKLNRAFTVCKVANYSLVNLDAEYCFIGKTDAENSLVCVTADAPPNATQREDGWLGLCIQGPLDFSLVGILSKIAAVLAERGIPIFAISTYDTDYVFVKAEKYPGALEALARAGYEIVD